MFSTTDGGLPYWQSEPSGQGHRFDTYSNRWIWQSDMFDFMEASREVCRAYRNIILYS